MTMTLADVRRLRAEADEEMRRASAATAVDDRRVHTAKALLLKQLADEFEREFSD